MFVTISVNDALDNQRATWLPHGKKKSIKYIISFKKRETISVFAIIQQVLTQNVFVQYAKSQKQN